MGCDRRQGLRTADHSAVRIGAFRACKVRKATIGLGKSLETGH